ncbi:FMN reductase [Duganella sp. CF402]|uniref:NADPH-dependent FMN reductase n=1 Tax=unclassified Duganella TaxID=2636909 RepID=UPI0008AC952D|nr:MULTISPECIES: NADPH-dependent FMN reductase [unclassified Duganella]RZT09927.1 FMN reductase [Duganella sp. BK701]SEL36727.1 FMN reductase [Duganella sp. CF402]
MSILLLGGSPAAPSSTGRLLDHVGDKLAALGHRQSKLNVRDLPAKALLHADFADLALKRAVDAVAAADAIVIATPIYKASYTGILKAFLDLLPQDGLKDKLVLPLATGGSQSHMLALDYALRPVLQALDARQVFTSIYATSQQLSWSDVSGLTVDPAVAWRVQAGVDALSAALNALRREPEQVFVTNAQPVRLAR